MSKSKIIVSAARVHKELAKAAKILADISELIEEADITLDVSMTSLASELNTISNCHTAIRDKAIIASVNDYASSRVSQVFGITPARVSQIAPRNKTK